MTAARIERSFTGAILCMITVILILFTFNNNEWVIVLSAHPSNFSAVMIGGILTKWEQRKTLRRLKTFATCGRLRLQIKTNVNSTCDVTDLDQIGPINVSWTTSADPSFTMVQPIMTWTWFKSTINVEPRFDRRWWNPPLMAQQRVTWTTWSELFLIHVR